MVSNKRYEDMKNFYDEEIKRINKHADYWRDRYLELHERKHRTDIYEAILAKQGILGEECKHTDKVFVFEGRAYELKEYHLESALGWNRELTVTFKEVVE